MAEAISGRAFALTVMKITSGSVWARSSIERHVRVTFCWKFSAPSSVMPGSSAGASSAGTTSHKVTS